MNFLKFLSWVFWRLALATCSWLNPVTKNACFAFYGQFFNKTFLSFPLICLWLFIVFLVWTSFKIIVFTHKSSYSPYSLSPFTNLQVKVWVLFPSQYVSHILSYTSWIMCFCFVSDTWIWVFDFWLIWCVILVAMKWLSFLCMYNVLFVTHTHIVMIKT